jgi:hypothetical protein
MFVSRETREGWPLQTDQTEVNGDSKSTNETGPYLVGSLGLSCQYKRFCSALVALVGQVENIFFLTIHYFNSFIAIAQKAGQTVVPGTLSLSMRLCSYLSSPKVCSDST